MRTPREILFGRHQSAEPKLDEIRERVVASVHDRWVRDSPAFADSRYSIREFILSLRWHLAGMGAAWVLIVLLNLNVGHSTTLAAAMPAAKIPPPQIILASLRENRRELLRLIQPAESREILGPKFFPRSERCREFRTA